MEANCIPGAGVATSLTSDDGGGLAGGGGGDGIQQEEEDEESSSSSSTSTLTAEESPTKNVARTYRRHRRVDARQKSPTGESSTKRQQDRDDHEDVLEEAKSLFFEGVGLERAGQHFSAILKYKKAVQLVPDIEFKAYEDSGKMLADSDDEYESDQSADDANEMGALSNPDGIAADLDLVKRFSSVKGPKTVCQKAYPTTQTHLSALPMELLLEILKWVISSSLDLKSLERCSQVCRGFYLAARAPDLWRLVCQSTWGVNGLGPEPAGGGWRKLYLSRPKVLTGGVYIGKMSYAREGERGFQDNEFYRSWHMVTYFRYLRFFPGGRVTMLTSADEPALAVKALAGPHGVRLQGVYHGHYRLSGPRVICVLRRKKEEKEKKKMFRRKLARRNEENSVVPEEELHFELEITGKRRQNQLRWIEYFIHYIWNNVAYGAQQQQPRCRVNVNNDASFPTLVFSGVRSYNAITEEKLG